jgi:hypothetical protein
MHIVNGQVKDCQQKQNGKKPLAGTKKNKRNQFFHGVMSHQIIRVQIC